MSNCYLVTCIRQTSVCLSFPPNVMSNIFSSAPHTYDYIIFFLLHLCSSYSTTHSPFLSLLEYITLSPTKTLGHQPKGTQAKGTIPSSVANIETSLRSPLLLLQVTFDMSINASQDDSPGGHMGNR